MRNLRCRLLFYYDLLINRLLTSAFVLVSRVEYHIEITDFKNLIMMQNTFKK